MSNTNVCKFPGTVLADRLTVHCFVRETDSAVMQKGGVLTHYRMLLIEEGEGTLTFDLQDMHVKSGDLVLGFCGERFSAKGDGNFSYMYVDFDDVRAEHLLRRFALSPLTRKQGGFASLLPFWSESLARASETTADLASESVLLYTFSRFGGTDLREKSVLTRMLELSDEQLSNPDLSLAFLAEELSYNPKYLSGLFKRESGVTYSEYLRALRVRYAVSLFDHGIASVKNVAILSGFSDPLYFSTVFKKAVGVSSTEYIKRSTNE